MKHYVITFWTIGGSGASCGLEPVMKRCHVKCISQERAMFLFFEKYPNLDEGNIIKVRELSK